LIPSVQQPLSRLAAAFKPACRKSALWDTIQWRGGTISYLLESIVETEWYNRAEVIQKRILQLRDSL
jgi:hypothetical protein